MAHNRSTPPATFVSKAKVALQDGSWELISFLVGFRRSLVVEAALDLAEQPNVCYRHQCRDAFPPPVQYDAFTITLDEIKHRTQVILNFTRYASS